MNVNQDGDEIVEVELFQTWSELASEREVNEAIGLILGKLNCKIERTNATKHGNIELQLVERT